MEYVKSEDEGVTWSDPLRCSPPYRDVWMWWPTRDLNGNFFKVRGRVYMAYFSDQYRWIKVDDLPFAE